MKKRNKEIFVVGDRVLVVPDLGEERSDVGLYLPKGVVEKEAIQGGRIVEVGTGAAIPSPNDIQEEPWQDYNSQIGKTKIQAAVGDYAYFLRKASVELKLDGDTYLIIPYGAILVVIRDL